MKDNLFQDLLASAKEMVEMEKERKNKSTLVESLRRDMKALEDAGLVSDEAMREFEEGVRKAQKEVESGDTSRYVRRSKKD